MPPYTDDAGFRHPNWRTVRGDREQASVQRTYSCVGSSDPSYLPVVRRLLKCCFFVDRYTAEPTTHLLHAVCRLTADVGQRAAAETYSMLTAAATRYRNPIVNRRRPLSADRPVSAGGLESVAACRWDSVRGRSRPRAGLPDAAKLIRQESDREGSIIVMRRDAKRSWPVVLRLPRSQLSVD